MNLLLAASLFFGGVFSFIVLSNFLSVYKTHKLTEMVTEQVITFLAITSYSFAEALNMKYDALRDAGTSEEDMAKIMQSDKILYEIWKKAIVTKAFPAYPRKHIKLLPTFDWDGALRPLDNIYYTEEYKTKEAQSNEQD
tara:strand:- start:35 stop:451 length:417 start_codon:yes stop_codon:yes gene_type:complete